MRIYISVPITGLPIEAQKKKADAAACEIRKRGHIAVNPFDTPSPPDEWSGKRKYAYYIGEDAKLLMECDAIYCCEGWELSTGCRIERFIAGELRLKSYARMKDIPNIKRAPHLA